MVSSSSASPAEVNVYEPHRAGLPKLVPYFKSLLARREFAAEFSKSGIRAANTQTVLGQLWLVLNPLLLALVYYFLISVLRGGDTGGLPQLAHLTGGLFLFTFIAGSMSTGASSVTGGGRLIMNMNFPRLLMPFAAARTAWFRFLPTLPVYALLHLLSGAGWSWTMLLSVVFLGYAVLFAMGIASLLATLQVYFRDTASFLPYFSRIWLYVSPILWQLKDAGEGLGTLMAINSFVNPLYSIVGGWVELSLEGTIPSPTIWLMGALWAIVMFAFGSLLFMSRERDFTVRL